MNLQHRGAPIDSGTVDHAIPHRERDAVSRSWRPSVQFARCERGRGHLTTGYDGVAQGRRPAAPERLGGWEPQRGTLMLWLGGAVGRATATSLNRALDARPMRVMRVVVDPSRRDFIDSVGLDALVRIDSRASKYGDRLDFLGAFLPEMDAERLLIMSDCLRQHCGRPDPQPRGAFRVGRSRINRRPVCRDHQQRVPRPLLSVGGLGHAGLRSGPPSNAAKASKPDTTSHSAHEE